MTRKPEPSVLAQLEAGWPRVEEALASGERRRVGDLLESAVGPLEPGPALADALQALEARLAADARYCSASRGHWMLADRVPAPPSALRMPTVRIASSEGDLAAQRALLEETRIDVAERRKAEAMGGFSLALRYANIHHGALRPPKHHLHLFPDTGPVGVEVELPLGQVLTAWWQVKPTPMLYGLEDVLGAYDPGQHVRIVRLQAGRYALHDQPEFDEALYASESRLFDLETLARLRRYGLSYRHELALLLGEHPEGLGVGAILEALEARRGFRPNPGTIRATLRAAPEFQVTAQRWRWAPTSDNAWRPDTEAAWQTLASEGEAYLAYKPYRAVLATLGTTLAPLEYVLQHARPSHLYVVASKASEGHLETILANYGRPLEECHLVITPHIGDLLLNTKLVHEGLRWLGARGFPPPTVLVEFTTGTKSMSAAAVLATFQAGCAYAYVDGRERDGSQHGIVVAGTEALRVVPGWSSSSDRLASLLRGG